MKEPMNLIGKRFGKLTVIDKADSLFYKNEKYKSSFMEIRRWKCKCDCGNFVDVRGDRLCQGKTQSCGCLQKERARQANHEKFTRNYYEEKEDYLVGYTTDNRQFYIDKEDYDLIKDYHWYFNDKGYVVTHKYINNKRRIIHLHRLVTNFKYDTVDHKDQHPENNRKSNLRTASRSENAMNSKLSKNNKSGVTGVHWKKRDSVWFATIGINGKQKWLGQFKTKEEAIKARLEAEYKYYNEFSPQKYLFKEYRVGGL